MTNILTVDSKSERMNHTRCVEEVKEEPDEGAELDMKNPAQHPEGVVCVWGGGGRWEWELTGM